MYPYYKHNITDIEHGLIELLQTIVILPNEDEITREALHLLSSYTSAPYRIFEENLKEIPQKYMPDVLYLLNIE